MTTPDKENPSVSSSGPEEQPPRPLSPAAQRALAEAQERRTAADRERAKQVAEVGGRDGPEPTRYGDWEKGGIVSDF